MGDAPVIRRRLRNRDSELRSLRRADSVERSITLGWPSVDCYYLESLESFARSFPRSLLLPSLSDFPFVLLIRLRSPFISLRFPPYISSLVSVSLFPPWLLLPPALARFLPLLPTCLGSFFFRIS